jgi:2-C-methyl-D-erythritol 2,4-cyclodiphosphate synthase
MPSARYSKRKSWLQSEVDAADNLRIGHGIDAHRLVADRPLMLGGIHVPFHSGLLGHSDGDCVVHALGDALLSAAGKGDIGQHFPSSDKRWEGIAGLELLHKIGAIIEGARIVSASAAVIAQEPKLAPFVEQMAQRMCEALSVARGVVRVSATTTDNLGFTGRGEGICASAVALLELAP